MADVQLEHGHLRIANALYEAIILAPFTGTQLKIVTCIIRLTYGWRQQTVRVSHGELARLCHVAPTGGFRRALEELLRNGVLVELERPSGRLAGAYMVNKDFESWGTFSVAASKLESLYRERPGTARARSPYAPAALPKGEGYVYYARDRRFVKIGFSRDPWLRVEGMKTARPKMVLVASERGSKDLEAQRHAQFAAARVRSDREWFQWTPEMEAHVASIGHSDGHSEPQPSAPQGSGNNPEEGTSLPCRSVPLQGAEPTPQGNGIPSGGINKQPKVKPEQELRAGKDIEIQERQLLLQRARESAAHDYATRMATAANNAITERWREQPNPLHWSKATQLASELIARNVPLDVARAAIADCIRRSKNDRPPVSFNFFANAIDDAMKATEQRALDRTDPAPKAPQRPARIGPIAQAITTGESLHDRNERERRQRDAYSKAKSAAGIAWGKDPKNATAYRALVADATQHYATFLDAPEPPAWAVRKRDELVITKCADAAGFPTFERWVADGGGGGERSPMEPPPEGQP